MSEEGEDNGPGCWNYDLMELVLNMRKTFDGLNDFLEEHNVEINQDEQNKFLDEILPALNRYSHAISLPSLMAVCGRMLEDLLDGHARIRLEEKKDAARN